jgi:hypothetical protein
MKNINSINSSPEENKSPDEERKTNDETSLVIKEAEIDTAPTANKRLIYHPDFLPIIIFASISALSWLTPLAGTRVVENSYALNYRGVNIASLYIAQGVSGVAAMPIAMFFPSYKSKVIFATIAGVIGTSIAALTGFAGLPADTTTTTFFFLSQGIISLNLGAVLQMVIQLSIEKTSVPDMTYA